MTLDFWSRRARSSRCIAIVGNGFDMAHDLKTGYNDFVNAQNKDTFAEYKAFLEKYPPRRFGFVLQSVGCYLDPKSKDGYKLPREANKMKIIGNIFDTPDLLQEINALGRAREGKQIE